MHKHITLIGATGSLGLQTLDIIRKDPELKVVALAVKENTELLREQIDEFNPEVVCVFDETKAKELSIKVKCRVVSGMDGLIEVATLEKCDLVITAVMGMVGIRPTVEAIKARKDIALANKETLVCAGDIIMNMAREYNVRILPVDSEHSAIFQCLDDKNPIKNIILTCSGGPFRGYSKEQLKSVTLSDALKHPTWNMGNKITIDSSTLVNKGLEVIEASHLFNVPVSKIQVVVHPESVVHSMVEFNDNAILAQLGTPDMRLPIAFAIYYPNRIDIGGRELELTKLKDLHFEDPDIDVFEGLAIAYRAAEIGGTMPAVFNASNEQAVDLFLNGKIKYSEIYEMIKTAMKNHEVIANPDINQILKITGEYQ